MNEDYDAADFDNQQTELDAMDDEDAAAWNTADCFEDGENEDPLTA